MKFFRILFLVMLVTVGYVRASELKVVQLEHAPNGDMLHLQGNKQLAVSGFSQFSRSLSLIDLTTFTSKAMPIPDDAQFFQLATLAGAGSSQVVFLGINGISALDQKTNQLHRVLQAESIYRVVDSSRLRSADFVVDLGSGLSDFIVPDFQYTHLYRQQTDGSFKHFALKVPALVFSWRDELRYEPRQHFLADVNADSMIDLVFVWQGKFHVFLQQQDGSFSTTSNLTDWPIALSTEQEADQRNDAGRSYSGQYIDTMRDITDIDADGVVDLVVNREQLADALERNNSFRVYFGSITKNGLQFNAEPDTQINTETSPIDVVMSDIDGDSRQDFYIPSTHFGVGTIIRVLLRGSANLDIDFFLLDAARKYPAKADFRQQATIDVSISNFRFDMPLFELADVDGNGNKDLLVGVGRDELKLYLQEDKRLFSRRSRRFDYALPRDARKVRVFDLSGNGKDDVILPFDALEAEELRNQLHFVLN